MLAEKLLVKNQAHVNLVISRPSIIDAAYSEPYPGWIDSLAAAAGVMISSGIGALHELISDPSKIGDQIPVDFVANQIIAITAMRNRKIRTPVYHLGTSDDNPLTWEDTHDFMTTNQRLNPIEKLIDKPYFKLIKNRKRYEVRFLLKSSLNLILREDYLK